MCQFREKKNAKEKKISFKTSTGILSFKGAKDYLGVNRATYLM